MCLFVYSQSGTAAGKTFQRPWAFAGRVPTPLPPLPLGWIELSCPPARTAHSRGCFTGGTSLGSNASNRTHAGRIHLEVDRFAERRREAQASPPLSAICSLACWLPKLRASSNSRQACRPGRGLDAVGCMVSVTWYGQTWIARFRNGDGVKPYLRNVLETLRVR